MPKLIKNGAFADNPWQLLAKDAGLEDCLNTSAGAIIVPLALWLEQKAALQDSGKQIAVWIDSDETPDALAEGLKEDLETLPMIALNFPVFSDGRNYSNAVSLRQRYAYKGELRAIGDVLRDQLFYMKRCGFDSFDVSDQVKDEDALSAFSDFHTSYASTVEEPLPLFKRREARS